ncbi:hypothetical protein [Sphingomonas sp. PWP1-2]|uniref:hypothetical protein n=1 Tax=Sphingomonas sp. PWP1-2 TaxID=2804558 RepID=UPI003CF3561C
MNARKVPYAVGDRVFFWSGRGSQGYAVIREIRGNRALLDPEPDALRGSDYRLFTQPAKRIDGWTPRDYGLPFSQINTPPRPWFQDN